MERNAELKYFICLLVLSSAIEIIAGICDRTCRRYPQPQKFVELKCRKRKDHMFYVDVRCSKTANGNCDGSVICSGLQQEVLRQVAEECYWNPRCSIVMNNTYPNILNLDGACTNVIPDVFESRALCVRSKKIFDFYGVRSPFTKKEGVIRISDNFPWDYSLTPVFSSVTFKDQRRKKLRITFLEADLDRGTDHLVLRNGQTEINVTEQHKNQNFDFENGDVTLEFSVGSSSRKGKGFVLCFSWLGLTNSRTSHACDLIRGVKCLPGKTKATAQARRSRNRSRNRRRRGNSTESAGE